MGLSLYIGAKKNFRCNNGPPWRRAPEQAWGSRLAAPAACALSPARTARYVGTCAARTDVHHTCENSRHVLVAVFIFESGKSLFVGRSSGCPWHVRSTFPATGASFSLAAPGPLGGGKGQPESPRRQFGKAAGGPSMRRQMCAAARDAIVMLRSRRVGGPRASHVKSSIVLLTYTYSSYIYLLYGVYYSFGFFQKYCLCVFLQLLKCDEEPFSSSTSCTRCMSESFSGT